MTTIRELMYKIKIGRIKNDYGIVFEMLKIAQDRGWVDICFSKDYIHIHRIHYNVIEKSDIIEEQPIKETLLWKDMSEGQRNEVISLLKQGHSPIEITNTKGLEYDKVFYQYQKLNNTNVMLNKCKCRQKKEEI